MKIIDISYGRDKIIRGEVQGETDVYYPSIDMESGRMWCSCPYFFHKQVICKHIKYLLSNVNYEGIKNMNEKLLYLPSDCELLDKELGGGFPIGIVTSIVGEPEVGKTLLMLQTACSAVSLTGKDVIFIETEGYREADLYLMIEKIFKKRFKLTDKDMKKFHFYSATTIERLMKLFGWNVNIEYGDNKMDISFHKMGKKETDINGMNIPHKVLSDSILLVMDSFTSPIKALVADDRKNFPQRAKIISKIFKILFDISNDYNLAILVSHHLSKDPTQMLSLGEEYGGNSVKYNLKWKVALMRGSKVEERKFGEENRYGTRRFRIIRKPGMPKEDSYKKFGILLKKDWGFVSEVED